MWEKISDKAKLMDKHEYDVSVLTISAYSTFFVSDISKLKTF